MTTTLGMTPSKYIQAGIPRQFIINPNSKFTMDTIIKINNPELQAVMGTLVTEPRPFNYKDSAGKEKTAHNIMLRAEDGSAFMCSTSAKNVTTLTKGTNVFISYEIRVSGITGYMDTNNLPQVHQSSGASAISITVM